MNIDQLIIEAFRASDKRVVYVSGHVPSLEALETHLHASVDMNSSTKLTLVLGVGARQLRGEYDLILVDDWVISEGYVEPNGRPINRAPGAKLYFVNHMTGEATEHQGARFVEL